MAKIVAYTSGTTVLVEMSEDELARLVGEPYWSCLGTVPGIKNATTMPNPCRPIIGATVNISAWWNRVHSIVAKEKELAKLSDTLHALADLIKGAWPTLIVDITTEKQE